MNKLVGSSPVNLVEDLSKESTVVTFTDEIIENLTAGNEILRTQVTSLKSTVNTQKKQISELKREKEVAKRLMTSQLEKFFEQQYDDNEMIKKELRDQFEEEKIVMIASFEEEKELLKEDYTLEIRDVRQELSQQIEKISAELGVVCDVSSQQSRKIDEYEKLKIEYSKVPITFYFRLFLIWTKINTFDANI